LTRTVVNELRLRLGRTQRRYDTDIPTLEKYLRARKLRDEEIVRAREAIPLFEEVIRREPAYAPAYAALATTYGGLALWYPAATGYPVSPSEATARMRPLTEKALEIDPMLPEAHAANALLHALARRWVDAEESFRHAMSLDPIGTPIINYFVLSTLEPWGRLDESLRTVTAALDADPLSLELRRTLSRIELSVGKYAEAMANCQHVLDMRPKFPYAEELCARALVATGRTTEALEILRHRPALNEGWIGYVYARTGRREEAEAIAERNSNLPNRQALIYAALGDKDRAFEALDRLAALNPVKAGAHLNYPELATLRGDPRVRTLRRKMGFPLP
jgi:tetratricopeptide (TPR) repeat protein